MRRRGMTQNTSVKSYQVGIKPKTNRTTKPSTDNTRSYQELKLQLRALESSAQSCIRGQENDVWTKIFK